MKGMHDMFASFKFKYSLPMDLSDSQILYIARAEVTLSEIVELYDRSN